MKSVVLDVWDGRRSRDHVARFVLPIDEALNAARIELLAGYSVNLWTDIAWGSEHNFDHRKKGSSGGGRQSP